MSYLEAHVQKQVAQLLSGDAKFTSYLDNIGHISNVYEVRGSKYQLVHGGPKLKTHDFTEYVSVTKDCDSRIVYNPSATDLLSLFITPSDSDLATPPSVAQPRKLLSRSSVF